MNRQIATAAEEQTSVAEDISRNLTEITAIATANQENIPRTESAGQNLHELSGQLSQVNQRLSATVVDKMPANAGILFTNYSISSG